MLLVITKVTIFRGDLTNTSAETEALAHTPPNDDVLEVVVCLTCYSDFFFIFKLNIVGIL